MKRFLTACLALILAVCTAYPSHAKKKSEPSLPSLTISAPSALLMEAETGTILYQKNEHTARPPASVTKIMTLCLIFDAIEKNQIALTDEVTVSEHAASMGGSQVFLEAGEVQTVETLIKCISIASANDACVAYRYRRRLIAPLYMIHHLFSTSFFFYLTPVRNNIIINIVVYFCNLIVHIQKKKSGGCRMSNIRIQRLSNILSRYSFTSGKISFLENNCKLNEFSKQDFDEALRFAELDPYQYLTKRDKRQALIDYYKQLQQSER